MKLVALLRVSTRGQVADGYGLEVQEQTVRAWAKANHHRLVAVVTEQVSGSAAMTERTGFLEALQYVATARAEGVVVPKLDRLSRGLAVQEQMIAEVQRLDGEVRSCNPTEDAQLTGEADDPVRALVRQIMGAINEYERAMIRLRMRAGLERKRERGGYCGGKPPYGWAAVKGELVPLESEQTVRRMIKEWNREGWNTQKIADRLNADGIKTRSGGQWFRATVGRVIDDKRRAGVNPKKAPARNAEPQGKVG